MRIKTLVLSLLILSGTDCIAQNKITQVDFDHLVDYANCKYLLEFIEQYDVGQQRNKDTFENNIKPELVSATLDDLSKVSGYNEIKKLVQKYSNLAALELAENINFRKAKYEPSLDASELIKALAFDSWKGIDLTGTAIKVQNAIRQKYNIDTASPQETLNNKPVENSRKILELLEKNQSLQQRIELLEQKINKPDSSHTPIWLAIFLTWLILFVLLLNLRRIKSQSTELDKGRIIDEVLEGLGFSRKLSPIEFINLPKSISLMEREIAILVGQVKELQNKRNSEGEHTNKEEYLISIQANAYDVKFFKSQNGRILTEEMQNLKDASFKVFNIKGNEASFEYIGGVVNQDFFTDVCSFVNNPSDVPNKTRITTTAPGVVKKDSYNKWEVTEKAKIKFE